MRTRTAARKDCDTHAYFLLPVRNGWPYSPTAADSVLCQTDRKFERIVADHGSMNLPETLLYYRRHPKHIWHGGSGRRRLAGDMAPPSARAQRSRRPDPLNQSGPTQELAGLLYAYAGARLLERDLNLLDAHQAQATNGSASGRHFGDGRKPRCRNVARRANPSLKSLRWRVAAGATLLSMAPGRALASMIGREGLGCFRY